MVAVLVPVAPSDRSERHEREYASYRGPLTEVFGDVFPPRLGDAILRGFDRDWRAFAADSSAIRDRPDDPESLLPVLMRALEADSPTEQSLQGRRKQLRCLVCLGTWTVALGVPAAIFILCIALH